MGVVVTKEQAIRRAQYLDLVYSQYGTLYDLIPLAPRPNTDPAEPPTKTHVDGVVGTIQPSSIEKPGKPQSASTTTSSIPMVSSEVNAIQSS